MPPPSSVSASLVHYIHTILHVSRVLEGVVPDFLSWLVQGCCVESVPLRTFTVYPCYICDPVVLRMWVYLTSRTWAVSALQILSPTTSRANP